MNLLLTGCFNYSLEQIEALNNLGYSLHFLQQEKEKLPIPASEINATVCNGLFLFHPLNKFNNLKFIQLTSAGFDRIPIEKIKARNIELHNARGVYSKPMAEWAVFQVLQHYKQGWFFREQQNSYQWLKHRGLREIVGNKVAIIGAGNVGQEVAKRFQALEAEVTGFDIHTKETPGFDYMTNIYDLKKRIIDFDIVIITAPLLPSTKGIISREILYLMKHDAMLVNIARGGLIDQKALCDVLTERKDLFAALDVFETEPLQENNYIWTLENVAISPHNSFVSDGNNTRMFNLIYNNLKNFIKNNEKIYSYFPKE